LVAFEDRDPGFPRSAVENDLFFHALVTKGLLGSPRSARRPMKVVSYGCHNVRILLGGVGERGLNR